MSVKALAEVWASQAHKLHSPQARSPPSLPLAKSSHRFPPDSGGRSHQGRAPDREDPTRAGLPRGSRVRVNRAGKMTWSPGSSIGVICLASQLDKNERSLFFWVWPQAPREALGSTKSVSHEHSGSGIRKPWI